MNITLQKIAKLANVSVSTASKALTYSKEVHEETAELVRAVAREKGYYTQKKLESVRNRDLRAIKIAVLTPELKSAYYARWVTLLEECLTENGIGVQVYMNDFKEGKSVGILKSCLEDAGVAGIINMSSPPPADFGGFPSVHMVTSPVLSGDPPAYDCVCADENEGLGEMVRLLVARGHRRTVFFGETLTQLRADRFVGHMKAAGVSEEEFSVAKSPLRFEEAGYDLAGKLLAARKPLPSAVFCAYDAIAFGAMRRFYEAGLSVPDDISVVSVTNVPMASYSVPSLTTVGFDTAEFCKTAVELLMRKIFSEKSEAPTFVRIPTHVILRESLK